MIIRGGVLGSTRAVDATLQKDFFHYTFAMRCSQADSLESGEHCVLVTNPEEKIVKKPSKKKPSKKKPSDIQAMPQTPTPTRGPYPTDEEEDRVRSAMCEMDVVGIKITISRLMAETEVSRNKISLILREDQWLNNVMNWQK